MSYYEKLEKTELLPKLPTLWKAPKFGEILGVLCHFLKIGQIFPNIGSLGNPIIIGSRKIEVY